MVVTVACAGRVLWLLARAPFKAEVALCVLAGAIRARSSPVGLDVLVDSIKPNVFWCGETVVASAMKEKQTELQVVPP